LEEKDMGRSLARSARITACLALGLPSLARAESLSLARVLEVVRAQNPAIAGANARADAAAAIPGRMRAWDDPVVSWEAWNIPESVAIGQADNNIVRLSQRIPFPGKRTLAGEMAARDADAMHHDAGAVALDALSLAKHAYVDLWRAQQSLAVMRRDLGLAERVSRLVAQRYATGGAEQTDVLMADVDVSHAEGTLRTAELAIDEAWASLAAIMSDAPYDRPPTLSDPPDPWLPDSPAALVERALQERPELAARDAAIARETTGARLAGKGYLPDFEVSVGRFLNHDAANGFGAMASMTVPLAWKSKYDAGVAEANARIIAAEADRRSTANAVRRDVMQAYLRARSARVQHDLFAGTHAPHAEQALRVTEAAYVAGSSPLPSLFATVREVQRVHLEHVTARADFEKAYADLERAVGADLPRPTGATDGKDHRHD
jgi:outer membrane protein TolC